MNKILFSILLMAGMCANAQQKLLVAVQQYRDSVIIFDANTHQKTGALKIGYKPHEITYDAVSKLCFVTNFGLEDYDLKIGRTGNMISVIDPFKGSLVNTIYTGADITVHNGPHGVKVRPGKARELFVNVEIGGDSMLVYGLNNLTIKRKFPLPKGSHNFCFSGDGKELWLMAGQDGVYKLDPKNGSVLYHATLSSPIRGLFAAKDWLIASGKNELFLLSKNDLSTIKHIDNLQAGQVFYSNITSDQKYIIAPVAFDGTILIIDVATGAVTHRLKTGGAPLNVQVSGNVAYVTHARDGFIGIIDLKTFEMTAKLNAFGTNGLVLIDK